MEPPELDDSTSSPTIPSSEHNLSTIIDKEDSVESFMTAQEYISSTPIRSNEEQPTLNYVFHQMTGSNIKPSNEKVENRHLTSSEKGEIDSVLHELFDTSLSSNGEGGTSEPLGSDSTSNVSTSVSDKTQDLHHKPIDKDFQEFSQFCSS